MRVFILIIGEGKLKSHQINGLLSLGDIIVHLPWPQLIPYFGTLHWQTDNFGLPYRIELRFGPQALETYYEGIHLFPCQSNKFQMGKMRVNDLGKLKSHKPPNPIKRMNKNLSINRHILLDILITIEYSLRKK